jgi:hypothetical protein
MQRTIVFKFLPAFLIPVLLYSAPLRAQVAGDRAPHLIVWEKSNRLKKSDFKGSIVDRPNEAETVGSIQYSGDPAPQAGYAVVRVETLFDSRESYFVGEADTAFTLEHEQGHFDLSEIHARKFVKAIREQVGDYREFERRHRELFDAIDHELQLHHVTYDQEIYASHTRQRAWLAYIRREMEALEPYADKKIILPLHTE